MFKMYACAALVAVPALVAPSMAEEEVSAAEAVAIAQVEIIGAAIEILTNEEAPPQAKAEGINELTKLVGELAEAKTQVDPEEWAALEAEMNEDEDIKALGETLVNIINVYAENDFEGSPELAAAITTFGEALSNF